MSVLFLVSGVSKLGAPEQTKAYMEAYGVPGYLLYPAAALEIDSGGMLLAAYHPVHTVWLAMVLAGWCLLTAEHLSYGPDGSGAEDQFHEEHGDAAGGGEVGPGGGEAGSGQEK
jgi:uncharacterized membrane protein YphA (DoxX/SURF4 family)